MTNEITKYEPMIVVELKNGRKLLTSATNRKIVEDRWAERLPIKIEGVTIDAYEIRIIEDLSSEYDVLIGLTEDQRNRALERFKTYEQNLGKKPDRKVKQAMIQKLFNNPN